MQDNHYWLTHVQLETGYQYENGVVSGTETGIFHVRVENGKFSEIISAATILEDSLPKWNMNAKLMLPSFRDMHIHLDKTYYGGPWKAPTIPTNGIFTRFEEEKELLPRLLPVARERAGKLIELLIEAGTTRIRSHCNIDPVVGLKNLEATLQAVEDYQGRASIEIVAFPQHGLLRSQSVSLMREALKNGASLVGGVDPATVDGDMERSLQTIMELAVEADSDIDLHLHDGGHLGIFTFQRLADLVEEAGWQGRVTLSHALALADISPEKAATTADRLASLGISIASSVPLGRTIPIPLLHDRGVKVSLGDDSIMDHWSPFGKGDMLEKAGILAERFNLADERALGQTLGVITGGITPLNRDGEQVWPRIGDEASMVFVDASCSAEAVARRPKRQAVFFKGNLVFRLSSA
ncbi:amidohydrolase family protein [Paenibacillus sp. KQZ6P-2]|uniref:Amidohydrolase family protein n=1 Tax=Paenibacillus mangrovi TaxID=2931978 RepID=A0A9X1WK84_9BACL|nr:amidohydrolase family protein [Paenibacillus mangrovi]MCJ8010266.1 amidohydrolase family protein [Paenibacillus mangrovi]